MAQEVTYPTIHFIAGPSHKDEIWRKMPCPGLSEEEIEKLADHLGERLEWFTWHHEMPRLQSSGELVTALRSLYATHPIIQQAADAVQRIDREQRTGANLLACARGQGWKDDGEGALEFMMRRCREVAFEDCGHDPSKDLRKIVEQMKKLYRETATYEGGYAITCGALLDFIKEIEKCLIPKT
jgi:hypothetical protein